MQIISRKSTVNLSFSLSLLHLGKEVCPSELQSIKYGFQEEMPVGINTEDQREALQVLRMVPSTVAHSVPG